MSSPPTGTAFHVITPSRASIAISEIPPPTSTTMLPTGSWIGRPAPIAAAKVSSKSVAERAPASVTASSTARRSTGVRAEGTQTSTRGLENLATPMARRIIRIICSASSKLEMAPRWSGRTATTSAGRAAAIAHACRPTPRTSAVRPCRATTVGSSNTTPWPCTYTRVLAEGEVSAAHRFSGRIEGG